jgi:hypothetical protein
MDVYEARPEKKSWELKRDSDEKARLEKLRAFWLTQLVPGCRILERVSGTTGEIRKIFDWGVEVWVPDLNYSRQNWTWTMLATRFPRKIKRYPRPFRFPRMKPIRCCHCQIGRMVVEGANKVRCMRCRFLIGDESFPKRIARATAMLKKKLLEPKPKRKVRKGVVRRKGKASHRNVSRKKVSRGVGVRSRGRKEKSRDGKSKRIKTNKTVPPPSIPGDPPIPPTPPEVPPPEIGFGPEVSAPSTQEVQPEGQEVTKTEQ